MSNVLGISKSPFKNNDTDRLVQVIFGIGFYGNGVAKKLPGSDRYCYRPHINDPGQIVWIRSNNGIPEIYLHANGLMKKNYSSGFAGYPSYEYPKINNAGQIIWIGYLSEDNIITQIFLYESGTIKNLGRHDHHENDPRMNDSGQFDWWNEDASIYLYSKGTASLDN